MFFPHITVWGSCFSLGSRRSPPSAAAAAPHSSLLITQSLITDSLTPSLTHSTPSLTHGGAAEPSGGAAARVGAAGPRLAVVWQVQYRELPGCVSRGRRSTQSLLEELRRAWPPLGRGCLQYTQLPGCVSRGRRSTQSLLAELRRVWPPLGRGCLSRGRCSTPPPGCFSRGRRSAESLLEELRRAWPPLGRGCLSRGRRSTQSFLAALRVAGAVHRRFAGCASAWQAQYTEPPGGAAARVAAAGPRLPFSWQA